MPTATLTVAGSITLAAPSYPPSAAQNIGTPISEIIYVNAWDAQAPTLSVDGAQAIPFPIGMTKANVFEIKVQGGSPIDLILTSPDGTAQIVPVDSYAVLINIGKGFTAISVQRTPGVSTPISYIIAQAA